LLTTKLSPHIIRQKYIMGDEEKVSPHAGIPQAQFVVCFYLNFEFIW